MFELPLTYVWRSTSLLIVLVNNPLIGRPSGKNDKHLIKAETKNTLINSLTVSSNTEKNSLFLKKEETQILNK